MSQTRLKAEILKLSHAQIWESARLEWHLTGIEILEVAAETCLCGYHPIRELCFIENDITRASTMVGNCCIHRFIGLPSSPVFRAAKRIIANLNVPMGKSLIDFASARGWLSLWEVKFCHDTLRKRGLSAAQLCKRTEINEKVLESLHRAKRARRTSLKEL